MKRVSLKQMLLLMAIVACITAWLARLSPQERIERILSSSLPDSKKLALIQKFAKLGDHEQDIFNRIGSSATLLGGSVQHDCIYESRLVLSFRSDGTLFRIGYNSYPNGPTLLVYHELDSWPLAPQNPNNNGLHASSVVR